MLEEQLLKDWIALSRIIKNDRLVEIPYNEALILSLAFRKDPEFISFRELLSQGRMLKSQLNRSVKTLEKKEWVYRQTNIEDRRCQELKLTEKGKAHIRKIHRDSLEMSGKVMEVLGKEDTEKLIEIFEKIIHSSIAI